MMKLEWDIKTCRELLLEYTPAKEKATKIHFTGVDNLDVYNITAPFWNEGELYIAGRVEARNSEDSEVIFFTRNGDVWEPKEDLTPFQLQDPFITRLDNELIFGGVEIYRNQEPDHKIIGWRTLLYRGKTIRDFEYAVSGPWSMKDLRLNEMADGNIAVFSRPFGVEGAVALIGFGIFESFQNLSESNIISAPVFKDQFDKNEWGGANEIHLLKNGLLGVLGHIAYRDEQKMLHYHAMSFVVNPWTREKSAMKIIAVRSDFPEGPAKRPDLVDVIFSGGMTREANDRAILYVGASDVESYCLDIPDPFTEYEQIVLAEAMS
ncbi:DUF1861 family protein [Paenibacillus kyungheensis]